MEAIDRGNRFLVSAHARPDGDAVGSILACGMMLEAAWKACGYGVLRSRAADLSCSAMRASIHQTIRGRGEYDAVILLECDGLSDQA